MGLAQQIAGGIAEVHRFCATADTCQLLSRTFQPVKGRRTYERTPADAGFIDGVDVSFDALKSDIQGMALRQSIGKILTFRSEKFVVVRFDEGELTTTFYCKAKNA